MGYGLDISSALSLVVSLTRKGQVYHLLNVAVLPGFAPSMDEKPESNSGAPIGEAWDNLSASGFRGGTPAVLMPGRDIVYRLTMVGSPNPQTIAPLVRLEADEISGGQGGILGDYVLGVTPDGAPAALIGLARDAVVDHYSNSLRAAGVPQGSLVPGCIALYNAYQLAGDVSLEGTLLVANIGDDVTDVILVKEGSLLFARTLSVGVNDFIDRLVPEYGAERDTVRQVLFRDLDLRPSVAADNIAQDRGVEGGQEAAGRLFQQVNSVIMLAKGAHQDPKLDAARVALCGPGAAIPGLRELMMHRLRKTVEIFNPLHEVDTSALDDRGKQIIENYRPALTLAVGLARTQIDAQAPKLAFTPLSVRKRREFLGKSLFLYLAAALVLAVLVPVYILSRGAADRAQGESREFLGIAGRYRAASEQIGGRQDALAQARRRADASMYAAGPGSIATRVMMNLSAQRPASVRISGATLGYGNKVLDVKDGPPPPPVLVVNLFVQQTADADPMLVITELKSEISKWPGVLDVVSEDPTENISVAGKDVKLSIRLKLDLESKP